MAAMCELARLSDLAANMLRQYADGPAVCSVTCSPSSVIDRARVRLQLEAMSDVREVRAVAKWAAEWNSVVLFKAAVASPGRVQVTTRLEAVAADGLVDIEVWTYVDEPSAGPLGLDFPVGVEVLVDPDVVLSRLDDTVSAAGVV